MITAQILLAMCFASELSIAWSFWMERESFLGMQFKINCRRRMKIELITILSIHLSNHISQLIYMDVIERQLEVKLMDTVFVHTCVLFLGSVCIWVCFPLFNFCHHVYGLRAQTKAPWPTLIKTDLYPALVVLFPYLPRCCRCRRCRNHWPNDIIISDFYQLVALR